MEQSRVRPSPNRYHSITICPVGGTDHGLRSGSRTRGPDPGPETRREDRAGSSRRPDPESPRGRPYLVPVGCRTRASGVRGTRAAGSGRTRRPPDPGSPDGKAGVGERETGDSPDGGPDCHHVTDDSSPPPSTPEAPIACESGTIPTDLLWLDAQTVVDQDSEAALSSSISCEACATVSCSGRSTPNSSRRKPERSTPVERAIARNAPI